MSSFVYQRMSRNNSYEAVRFLKACTLLMFVTPSFISISKSKAAIHFIKHCITIIIIAKGIHLFYSFQLCSFKIKDT